MRLIYKKKESKRSCDPNIAIKAMKKKYQKGE